MKHTLDLRVSRTVILFGRNATHCTVHFCTNTYCCISLIPYYTPPRRRWHRTTVYIRRPRTDSKISPYNVLFIPCMVVVINSSLHNTLQCNYTYNTSKSNLYICSDNDRSRIDAYFLSLPSPVSNSYYLSLLAAVLFKLSPLFMFTDLLCIILYQSLFCSL